MKELAILLEILDKSVKNYGNNKTVTLAHLRNIVALAITKGQEKTEQYEKDMDEVYNETLRDASKYGY